MLGSGCLIAPGLVLTAYHVACPGGDIQPATIRDKSGRTAEAELVWSDTVLDTVLLRTDRDLGAGLAVVRWGELTCDYPEARPVCTMTGFPRAMRLPLPNDPETFVADPKTVDGNIKPATGSRAGYYGFELVDVSTGSAALWQGMSGAGAFCRDMLVGLATFASDHWQGGMLHLIPAARLFASVAFTDTLTAMTGMVPQLQSADLSVLFTDVPDPQLSSSYLLNARSAVVPMTGMHGKLDALEAWCRTSRPMDITSITGVGGIGKTRLVTELLKRLAQPRPSEPTTHGWTGGFLADIPHKDPPPYGMLATSKYPLLVVIDYAETRRGQVDQVLDALAAHRNAKHVRVILLARGRDNWWPSLRRARQGTSVMSTGASVDLDPADALAGTSSEQALEDAKRAFAERIHALQEAGLGDDWTAPPLRPAGDSSVTSYAKPADDTVISLHMAALADVLAALNDDFARYENPMDVLIAHEMSYWRRIVEARGEFFDEKLMRTLVSVQALTGAKNSANAQAAVAAGFDVHHRGFPNAAPPDARLLAAYEDILTAAYPSGNGAHWGAMGPDLLGAELIAEVEDSSDQQFVEQLLPHPYLNEEQQHQGLTIIARATADQPALAAGAARAVAAAPGKLLSLAAKTVTAELDPEVARPWLLGLQDAITEQAQRPDADPHTCIWATDLVSTSLTHLETGLGDYFGSPESSPPTEQLDTDHPGTDDRPEEDTDELVEEEQDRQVYEDEDAPGAEEDRTDNATAAPARHGHALAPRLIPAGAAAHPVARETVVIHTITGRITRIVLTSVALAHLVLVAFVTGSVAYFSDNSSDPSVWFLPPFMVCAHLAVGALYGRLRLRAGFGTLVLPPLVLLPTVGFGMMFDDMHSTGISPVVLGTVWASVFSLGLLALSYAFRAWLGQIQSVVET
uniref:serine protease n=1 Tax=Streptomyces antimycoticus TaxID=68175 RepID=UPI002F90AF78